MHRAAGKLSFLFVGAAAALLAGDCLAGVVPLNPDQVPGLNLWLTADALTGLADGARISAWNDQSGAGHHALQTDPAKQPAFRTAGLGGRPALAFDGGDSMAIAGMPWPATIFAVARALPSSGGRVLSGQHTTYRWDFGYIQAGLAFRENQENRVASAGWDGSAAVIAFEYVPGDAAGYVCKAGQYGQAVKMKSDGAAAPWHVGSRWGQADFLQGEIAEVVAYNRPLSAAERQGIVAYLAGKYALPAPPDGPEVGFAALASKGAEAATPAGLVVSLSEAASQQVSVAYSVVGGNATPGVDFALAVGALTFAPGQVSKTINLAVIDDQEYEADETVEVALSAPGGGAMLGPYAVHTYRILNDDLPVGGVLHNGIVLTSPWPPRNMVPTLTPPRPPYLDSPPAVIPIDVGRQLFVDDFLIERTTLTRTFHKAEYHPACPLLTPDMSWERPGRYPTAMPFSDGVWYDPADQRFKMWYMGGYVLSTCYAESADGIQWTRPALDVVPGTNIVQQIGRDSSTVWLDLEESDPARRFKMFRVSSPWAYWLYFSPDGIHWGEPVLMSGPCGDRSTAFYNPFMRSWVYSIRAGDGPPAGGRSRRYWQTPDLPAGSNWEANEPPYWIGADGLDLRHPAFPNVQPQLYNLDCVAYESLVLGLFTIWRGDNGVRPKINEVCLGFSRDGFYWDRPVREAFIGVSEDPSAWNWGNVQSAGGGCLIVGDKLYFYVSGRTSQQIATGLATLRRDGFASMDAGSAGGTLTTRPLVFHGKHLFVNADTTGGELRVEALDADENVIAPFTAAKCVPIRADATKQRVAWQGAADLSALKGRPVRLRFHLTGGRLYAFWVSADAAGHSGGYVAAGGPGFTSSRDLAPSLRGDFDGDGQITAADVDMLWPLFGSSVPPADPKFDLTNDGRITFADAVELVENIVGTSMADTNLDHAVNILDLGNLANFYGQAGLFSSGDTNGDGRVDFLDLGNMAGDYGMTFGVR